MMKLTHLVFAVLFFCVDLSGQSKIYQKLEINKVKVFSENAQIVRSGKISLTSNTEILTLTGLSPYIIESSITVGGQGDFQIISLRRVTNQLDTLVKKKEYAEISKSIEELNLEFKKIDARLTGLLREQEFILTNRDLVGSDVNYSLEKLKLTADYFRERIQAIELEELELMEKKYSLNSEKAKFQSQLRELQPDPYAVPLKQVELEVSVERSHIAQIELSYIVSRAGWHSEYDLRVGKLSEGMELKHKAAIFQNTEVEWRDIEIALSTAEPQLSADAPSLNKWILGESYHRPISRVLPQVPEPSYRYSTSASLEGFLTEEDSGEPIIFASVVLYRNNIVVTGGDTDINGYYDFDELLPGTYMIEFSYVGFKTKRISDIRIENQQTLRYDATLAAGVELQELVVTSLGVSRKKERRRSPQIDGVSMIEEEKISGNISSDQVSRTTSREYLIDIPLSVSSDGNPKKVVIEEKKIDAHYEHQCTPKIDLNAYLIARLTDWEQYNFPQGHSSLYFEDTYVGKTFLNFEENTTDTISVSLGRDENVILTRERSFKKTKTPFLGKKKTEIAFDIKLRNTKDEVVLIKLYDQIPISTRKEVVVDSEHGRAALNEETGLLTWEFSLEPNREEKKDFRYTVTYPKYSNIALE